MPRRPDVAFAVILAALIAFAVWAGGRNKGSSVFDVRASTLLSGPSGAKGLHEVLSRLGHRSLRRRTPLVALATERSRRPAMLVLLNPFVPLQRGELEQVVRYVRGGGAVLATGFGAGLTRCAGWRTRRFGGVDSIAVREPAPGLRLPAATRVLIPDTPDSTDVDTMEMWDGDADLTAPLCRTLVAFETDTLVAGLNGRPIIVRLRYRGGGSITLVADPGWFTNRAWRDTDVPVVAVPLLTAAVPPSGHVAWDEYHQGFGTGGSAGVAERTWSWLRGSPAGWMILQLLGVGLVWLAISAVRSGPARAVIVRRRRSPLEHLEALGAGLEGAGDTETAIRRLVLGLRRRLSRGTDTAHAASADLASWLDGLELAMRGPRGREAVRRLHDALTARAAPDDRTERVLHAAQAVEDVWEELRPRRTRNGS